MITLRQGTEADVQTLQRLNDEVFVDNAQYDDDLVIDWAQSDKGKEYFTKLLTSPDAICYIAEDGDKAVGYIACAKKVIGYRKSTHLEIENMGVSPAYQSKGIGTMLMDKAKQWAKAHGYQRLYVNSYIHNVKAIAFYQYNGFVKMDMGLEMKLL